MEFGTQVIWTVLWFSYGAYLELTVPVLFSLNENSRPSAKHFHLCCMEESQLRELILGWTTPHLFLFFFRLGQMSVASFKPLLLVLRLMVKRQTTKQALLSRLLNSDSTKQLTYWVSPLSRLEFHNKPHVLCLNWEGIHNYAVISKTYCTAVVLACGCSKNYKKEMKNKHIFYIHSVFLSHAFMFPLREWFF